ncbi:MAG: HlyD family secretion protein [Saprospiraceae bacterium]
MRRFNLLYLALPVAAWALYGLFNYLSQGTATFFGVAENLETHINLDQDATVNRIHVSAGQFVTKGTLLLEVTRTALGFKASELGHEIAELEANDRLRVAELQGNIKRLHAQRTEKTGGIQARIRTLEAEQALNRSLLRELKSVAVADTASNTPSFARLNALRDELRLATEPVDAEIARIETELRLTGQPVQAQIKRLKNDMAYTETEQGRLLLRAPSDGLIGAIQCREGENVPAFGMMISFYEQNPTRVVGYVHESLILEVKVDDHLSVASSLRPGEQCLGRISGLGHRVVEIPERLRKIPEIKAYGREVIIQIPSQNSFLQKEKVLLRLLNSKKGSLLSFLKKQFASTPEPGTQSHQ